MIEPWSELLFLFFTGIEIVADELTTFSGVSLEDANISQNAMN
jgi:hypothetical protein